MSAQKEKDSLPIGSDALFSFLQNHEIEFRREDHEPVFTVEDSKSLNLKLQGGATKNLFLRDKKGKRHFLLSMEQEKQVNLKSLSALINSSRLSLGSSDRLLKHLGVLPGAVSLLALVNDRSLSVEVLIDKDLWHCGVILCHPLVNSSTLAISCEDLELFFLRTGHSFQLVEIPSKTILADQ